MTAAEFCFLVIGFCVGVIAMVVGMAQGALGSISLRDSAAGHQAEHDAEILLREINKPTYTTNRSNS